MPAPLVGQDPVHEQVDAGTAREPRLAQPALLAQAARRVEPHGAGVVGAVDRRDARKPELVEGEVEQQRAGADPDPGAPPPGRDEERRQRVAVGPGDVLDPREAGERPVLRLDAEPVALPRLAGGQELAPLLAKRVGADRDGQPPVEEREVVDRLVPARDGVDAVQPERPEPEAPGLAHVRRPATNRPESHSGGESTCTSTRPAASMRRSTSSGASASPPSRTLRSAASASRTAPSPRYRP